MLTHLMMNALIPSEGWGKWWKTGMWMMRISIVRSWLKMFGRIKWYQVSVHWNATRQYSNILEIRIWKVKLKSVSIWLWIMTMSIKMRHQSWTLAKVKSRILSLTLVKWILALIKIQRMEKDKANWVRRMSTKINTKK